MFEAVPRSISVVSYHGSWYLAVACGHLQNAKYSGYIEVRKFDPELMEFIPWQSLELNAPIQVEFTRLPSEELVLYVVSDNPTQPLIVYRYEGVAGFREILKGSTLPKIKYINLFKSVENKHFIIAQGFKKVYVIEAVFKGDKML